MRISVKLTAGFLAIAAVVALVGYLTRLTNSAIHAHVEQLRRSALVEMVDASDMAISLQESHDALHDLITAKRGELTQHPPILDVDEDESHSRKAVDAALGAFQHSFDRSRAANESAMESAGARGVSQPSAATRREMAERFVRLKEAFQDHCALVKQCLALVDKNVAQADELLEAKLDPHFNDVLFPLIRDQRKLAEQEFADALRGAEQVVDVADARNTWATVFALLAASALGLVLSRSIAKPLRHLQSAALQIGKGRLDTRIPVRSRNELGVLAETFNRMASDLQATTVSKASVDNILESMSELLVVTNARLEIQLVNRAGQEQLGYTAQELIGRPLARLFADPILRAATGTIPRSVLGVREHVLATKQGQRIPVHWAASELREPSGGLQGIVCAALNITERKLAEQRLRASLAEKEVLLKEVHHRVKNNLQIISSLLTLQARETTDADAHRMFEECQGRIRSMALIHEQLYQSGELARIDFCEYARRLCAHLVDSVGALDGRVALRIDVTAAPLPLNLAIPCGMILNELVSNALKHAFPGGRRGQIVVGFHAAGARHELSVRDDGVGLAGRSAAQRNGSLGLKVVEALVRQLGGRLQLENLGGACFTISFDDPTEAPVPAEDMEACAVA